MTLPDKRDVIRDCFAANPHLPPTPDAILNALHQAGWAIVPKARVVPAEPTPEAEERAARALYTLRGLRDIDFGYSSGQVAWDDTSHGVRESYREEVREVLRAALGSDSRTESDCKGLSVADQLGSDSPEGDTDGE